MRKALYILFFVFASSSMMAQTDVIKELEENAAFGEKLFLYSSMLRSMNVDQNPDYNKLIGDLDHIKVLRAENETAEAKALYRALQSSINEKDFEEVFSAEKRGEGMASIYFHDDSGKEQWIACLQQDKVTAVFVMNGGLDLNYLKGLSSLDQDLLKKYVIDQNFDENWD